MDYYVYAYLDPREIGKFFYDEYSFESEPFYIGKGRNRRSIYHLLKTKRGNYPNLPTYHHIKKILDSGLEPIIIKIKEDLLEENAFSLEKELIKKIGRKDLNLGPLRNLSDGGEGNGNRSFTDEHREKLSLSKKGKMTENMKKHLKKLHSKMQGNKHTLGFKHSQESKDRMSASHRKKPVIKMSLSGEIIEEFSSIREAKEKTGIGIQRCLDGTGKTAGGFLWKYKEGKNAKI